MTNRQLSVREEVSALKKTHIVAAAVELFYENGYRNTSLDAVAEKLGFTKPFIYSYFDSKSQLLAEICSRSITSSLAAMDSVISMDLSPTEKLALFGERFVRAVLESKMYMAIYSREEKNLAKIDLDRINLMRRELDQKLAEELRIGMAKGEFSIRDAHLTALSIGGMVSWAYVWYRDAGRLSIEETAQEMSRLIMAMVTGPS